MCLDILRNAPAAIANAKKQKKMGKTAAVLGESAVLFAAAAGVIIAGSGLYSALLISSVVSVLVTVIVAGLLLGLIIHIAASTLGGKGKYFEGLTAVTYALLPISAAMLISAVLTLLPFTSGLQLIVIAVGIAYGFAILYRGIKELYSTDMVTSLVAVSVSILALLMAVYASVGLSLLTRVAALPV
ncbi:MAG TPA: Yip1 family protein [archaeon]|nr:Yip1 family protein [archaeon]